MVDKSTQTANGVTGTIFDIDSFAMHDGPGIRMAVYFKGCPMSCKWCHSPESQKKEPELVFLKDRCVLCGKCVDVCSQSCHRLKGQEHVINRPACLCCGKCVASCLNDTLEIKGFTISSSSIVEKALRFKKYFDASGGGITLTGGEITTQVEFAHDILSQSKSAGIHTAVETCGACDWHRIENLLPFTDLLLYDIKLIDDQAHHRWTGLSNKQILDNALKLKESGASVQIRLPLIPEITDTNENLDAVFKFMKEAELSFIALLPYNAAAAAKYSWLGLSYDLEGSRQDQGRLEDILSRAKEAGLNAVIG